MLNTEENSNLGLSRNSFVFETSDIPCYTLIVELYPSDVVFVMIYI